ncbi:MAG TPA: type IV toxin-antitoxin system AbiEi family antitoxin domain-containing protein [Solirubrobacteraceae bacterium]|nr:type IV toxin-antitoxin system AbiEi family antitoxin domain-containing protein [Solirubrobacteraceae bacterium]
MRGEAASVPADAAVARLAARQHGVVSRGQLRALGLGDGAIDRRASRGSLHRLHRGVYAVGHPLLTPRGHWLAAVLACGTGAVLSHAAAAALWELRATAAVSIDVTAAGSGARKRPGVRVHRARSL